MWTEAPRKRRKDGSAHRIQTNSFDVQLPPDIATTTPELYTFADERSIKKRMEATYAAGAFGNVRRNAMLHDGRGENDSKCD
jgi:hypothetical protein